GAGWGGAAGRRAFPGHESASGSRSSPRAEPPTARNPRPRRLRIYLPDAMEAPACASALPHEPQPDAAGPGVLPLDWVDGDAVWRDARGLLLFSTIAKEGWTPRGAADWQGIAPPGACVEVLGENYEVVACEPGSTPEERGHHYLLEPWRDGN